MNVDQSPVTCSVFELERSCGKLETIGEHAMKSQQAGLK
jgi:hypothetical protein